MSAQAAREGMPLAGHLREARTRALRAGVALGIALVVGFLLADPLLDLLRTPIEQIAASHDASLNYDSLSGAFDLRMKITVLAGLVLSSPVWLFEAFAFVSPGLTRTERRGAVGFLAAALPLFAAGCVTGLALFPNIVEVLTSFAAEEDTTILQASYYVDFAVKLMFATGVAFTLPVFVVVANRVGMLPARTIVRSWRVWIVAIVLFSALVTPAADVLSMFIIAVPLALLFAAAAATAVVHDRRVARRAPDDPTLSPTRTLEPTCSD